MKKMKAKKQNIHHKSGMVDISGKKAGRGAYLCPSQECWKFGLKGSQLEHSLKTTLTQDNREQLIRFGEDFLKERGSAKDK